MCTPNEWYPMLRQIARVSHIYHSPTTWSNTFGCGCFIPPIWFMSNLKNGSGMQEQYGAGTLVDEHVSTVLATSAALRGRNIEVDIFCNFLEERWGIDVLNVFLKMTTLVDDVRFGAGVFYYTAVQDTKADRFVGRFAVRAGGLTMSSGLCVCVVRRLS
jgi:hypothetical protein